MKSLKGEIASLRADLANYKENESKLEKDKEHLEKVLEAALAKLFPEKYGEKISDSVNMDFLTSYVQENCTMWWWIYGMKFFCNPPPKTKKNNWYNKVYICDLIKKE